MDPVTYERYRTWFEGYGINTTTDAQGSFLGDRRKMYGGLAGAGVTVTPGVTFGLSVDRNTTDADLPGASGRIDMTQIGAHRLVRERPMDARRHGHSRLRRRELQPLRQRRHVDRGLPRPALGHDGRAQLLRRPAQQLALRPQAHLRLAPLHHRRLRRDRRHQSAFGLLGDRHADPDAGRRRDRAHSWLVGRQIFDFAVYGRLVDNLAQNIGDLIINDTTVVTTPQLVTGVRESTLGADAGATFSVKVSQVARLYAVYDGRFRSNLTSHAGTVGAEFRW